MPDRLPDNTVPYKALGVARYLKGDPFTVHGWEEKGGAELYL
ncbi:hypothetical protein [Streptomyces sp. NBC_00620]|nr:hypothetical protein [Streptomyces sp. NBC_00620]MCX4976456.1 hypothetical protein [Streptomyces sp. NBC_00620]